MHLITITAYTITPQTRSKRIAVDLSESDGAELRQMAEEHHLALTRLAAIAIGDPTEGSRAGAASAKRRAASLTEMPNPFKRGSPELPMYRQTSVELTEHEQCRGSTDCTVRQDSRRDS
jgi:hypothetical protein